MDTHKITEKDVLFLIGAKEVELFILKQKIVALEEAIKKLTPQEGVQ